MDARDAGCFRARRSRAGPRNGILLAIIVLALGSFDGGPRAADLVNATFTPVKGPDCVTDAAKSFFAQGIEPPANTPLPYDRFYLVARHMGRDAVAAAPWFDFSRIPDDHAFPPARGLPLTGFAVPDPKPLWQRSNRADATVDTASAFQLHCYDAGSFINTWTFPSQLIIGGGPHTIYGYSFNEPPPPAIFDGHPDSDFVLQANIEIPWFARWPDPTAQAQFDPVGQVSLFAYFRDRLTAKSFALLLGVFDNRAGANGTYVPMVSHDGFTPFATTPLNGLAAYATLSPFSATYTGVPWSGLRFFRGHVSQRNFRDAINDINVFCASARALPFCSEDPRLGVAFSSEPTNYLLTDFGVLHEVFRGGPYGNLSMGLHISGLGAWNAR
jgi:hypothetical protein